jgi:predicted acylesterase/phospholipase RssA
LEPSVDLIVGVSVGAILGALLATQKIGDLLDERVLLDVQTLFQERTTYGPWKGPVYLGERKRSLLYALFDNMTLGEVGIDLVILSDRLQNRPVLFQSWEPAHHHLPLYLLLDATGAVPILFPPVWIEGERYIDGGTVTVSPITLGFQLGLLRFPGAVVSVLSVGTLVSEWVATSPDHTPGEEMGIVKILMLGLPSKVLSQRSWLTNQLTKEILGSRYLRLEGVVNAPLNDVTVGRHCLDCAQAVWQIHQSEVRRFLVGDELLGIDPVAPCE